MRIIDRLERPGLGPQNPRARGPRNLVLRLIPLAILLLILPGCAGGRGTPRPPLFELSVTENPSGGNFTLRQAGQTLFLVYPDLDLLSLNLATAGLSGGDSCALQLQGTAFLDRISDTPEIDANFGKHWFSCRPDLQRLFYLDSENEGKRVLKWLSKGASDTQWWIDVLPFQGTPLGGWTGEGAALSLVIADGQSLFLWDSAAAADPIEVSASFVPSGAAAVLQSGDYRALTAYDARSRRLYLLWDAEGGPVLEPVYAGGEVHHATFEDGKLLILVYDRAKSALLLLERAIGGSAGGAGGGFEVTPVSLSEGTSSVFVTVFEGRRYFLFNEVVGDGKNAHQLSLLYPEMKGSRYHKSVLTESASPLQRFVALQRGGCLYVACLQEGLKLISFSLAAVSGQSRPPGEK